MVNSRLRLARDGSNIIILSLITVTIRAWIHWIRMANQGNSTERRCQSILAVRVWVEPVDLTPQTFTKHLRAKTIIVAMNNSRKIYAKTRQLFLRNTIETRGKVERKTDNFKLILGHYKTIVNKILLRTILIYQLHSHKKKFSLIASALFKASNSHSML